jgi:hypothetical protein
VNDPDRKLVHLTEELAGDGFAVVRRSRDAVAEVRRKHAERRRSWEQRCP